MLCRAFYLFPGPAHPHPHVNSDSGPDWGRSSSELELEPIQSHMAQKPVLRGEVGCACVLLLLLWAIGAEPPVRSRCLLQTEETQMEAPVLAVHATAKYHAYFTQLLPALCSHVGKHHSHDGSLRAPACRRWVPCTLPRSRANPEEQFFSIALGCSLARPRPAIARQQG